MRRWILAAGMLSVLLVAATLLVVGPAEARRGEPGGPGVGETNDLTTEEVRSAVDAYLDGVGFGNLEVGTTIAFDNHTWVAVIDPLTGDGAMELVVAPDGVVHPQRTLMWNTTYHAALTSQPGMTQHGMNDMNGMMGGGQHSQMHGDQGMMPQHGAGMMNHDRQHQMDGTGTGAADQDRMRIMDPAACQQLEGQADSSATLDDPLNADTAREAAQGWLDTNDPGTGLGSAVSFPGYFTFEVETDGAISGLLSVQAMTGAIMPQAWHGSVAK